MARGQWRWLKVQLTAAPRKTAVLALLVLVLVMVLLRLWRRGPAALEAAAMLEPAGVDAEAPVAERGRGSRPVARWTESAAFAARDPFTVDWGLFPSTSVEAGVRSEEDGAGNAVRSAGWSLELTLTSADGADGGTAVINGRPVGVGDWIEGATVESISAQEVVLSTPDLGRLVLRMD